MSPKYPVAGCGVRTQIVAGNWYQEILPWAHRLECSLPSFFPFSGRAFRNLGSVYLVVPEETDNTI